MLVSSAFVTVTYLVVEFLTAAMKLTNVILLGSVVDRATARADAVDTASLALSTAVTERRLKTSFSTHDRHGGEHRPVCNSRVLCCRFFHLA